MRSGNFFEDDEPVEDVIRAFNAGERVVTGREHESVYVECYHHGREIVDTETFRVCLECQHAFRAGELLDAHNAILRELRAQVAAETRKLSPTDAGLVIFGLPVDSAWTDPPPLVDATDPNEVAVCPLCTHDF